MQEKKRINKEGELVIQSQRTRSQLYVVLFYLLYKKTHWNIAFAPPFFQDFIHESNMILQCRNNVDDALEKLQEILDAAWKAVQPIEEDPEKKKKLDKQVERGNEQRLQTKKFKSDKKKERRAKIDW